MVVAAVAAAGGVKCKEGRKGGGEAVASVAAEGKLRRRQQHPRELCVWDEVGRRCEGCACLSCSSKGAKAWTAWKNTDHTSRGGG